MSLWAPLEQLAADVRQGSATAKELVERSLARIDEKSEYNAIISTVADRARERAAAIDERVARGEDPGRLAGVPFIVKDNLLTFGGETTAASNMLKGFVAPYQATVVERLEAEGAVCVAKANLDAFGHGGSTGNSDFGVTKNPVDPTKVAGGSSGGSAAAVVLEMAPFALGTDTGGSTRQPASWDGCIGYKPTYGMMSRSGVVAMASSTDTVGTLARSVEDVALVADIMAGPDRLDATTLPRDLAGYADLAEGSLEGVRFGIIKEWTGPGVDPAVQEVITAATDKLTAAGASLHEVSLPSLPLSLAIYYIVIPAEISSNLSRYDGQRFPFAYDQAADLEQSYLHSRGIGFGREAERRIIIGTYVLSSGYYDAYYKQAQMARTKLCREFEAAYENVDYLLGPVAPSTAFTIGQADDDPLGMYLADMMTVGPSLAGAPAISLPAGSAGGMPVGLQLIAPLQADRRLLQTAKQIQGTLWD